MTIDGGLRGVFRAHLTQFMWTSIETGGTGLGVADSNYLARATGTSGAVEGWIEYKQTDGHAVTLRPEQIGWLERRARYGGRVWIAVRQHSAGGPRRGPPVDALHLIPGGLAPVARAGGLRDPVVRQAARCWHGGPAGWDWPAVAALLAGAAP